MNDPIPYVASSTGSAASAPDGAVPIALYGVGANVTRVPNLADLAGDADLAAVIAGHNALLARLRTAGILGA